MSKVGGGGNWGDGVTFGTYTTSYSYTFNAENYAKTDEQYAQEMADMIRNMDEGVIKETNIKLLKKGKSAWNQRVLELLYAPLDESFED